MCAEERLPIIRVGDVGIDEEAVCFLVYALHGHLEAVETPCLGDGDLSAEAFGEVFDDDAVGAGEECEDHGYKVPFVGCKVVLPVE